MLFEEAWLKDCQPIIEKIHGNRDVVAIAQLIPENLIRTAILDAANEDHRIVLRMCHQPLDKLLGIASGSS